MLSEPNGPHPSQGGCGPRKNENPDSTGANKGNRGGKGNLRFLRYLLFNFSRIGARDSSRFNERMNKRAQNFRDASATRALQRTTSALLFNSENHDHEK